MPKKSTKYQLLYDDFRHACEELRKSNEIIKQQQKQISWLGTEYERLNRRYEIQKEDHEALSKGINELLEENRELANALYEATKGSEQDEEN